MESSGDVLIEILVMEALARVSGAGDTNLGAKGLGHPGMLRREVRKGPEGEVRFRDWSVQAAGCQDVLHSLLK